MATAVATAMAAVAQKSTRQLANWAMAAATGMPRAPPMPMDELIRAMAEPAFSLDSTSWIREIPSGIMPVPRPWRPRPRIITTTSVARAQTMEPRMKGVTATSIIRFLPYRSANRPITGVLTAPTSRVAVITQEAVATSVPKMTGRSPRIGTTSVCARDTTMPVAASTATRSRGFTAGEAVSGWLA